MVVVVVAVVIVVVVVVVLLLLLLLLLLLVAAVVAVVVAAAAAARGLLWQRGKVWRVQEGRKQEWCAGLWRCGPGVDLLNSTGFHRVSAEFLCAIH